MAENTTKAVDTDIEVEVTADSVKAYTLRDLKSDDVFPMFKIISKIGIKEFKSCFESEDVKKAISSMFSDSSKEDKANDVNLNTVGLTVAMDVACLVISHLPECKEDIYLLLSQLSGMKKNEIADLPMMTFTEMIVDVLKKEEFKDFIKVVSKLFK